MLAELGTEFGGHAVDLEFSLANFLLFGSAEQLMDFSLTKPYSCENKLPDRLLAIPVVRENYTKVVK